MSAAKYDLTIPRGADYDFTLRILDINEDPVSFTGSCDFKAEIREAHRKPLAVAFSFDTFNGVGVSNTDAALATGEVKFKLTDTQTKSLDVAKKYEWDFFWTDSGGLVHRLLYGAVNCTPNITHV